MRSNLFALTFGMRSRSSLSARGHFLNTFAGMGFCLALLLLAAGGYLIEEQFANPLGAQSAELLFSASLIATAVTVLYCLLHPFRKRRRRTDRRTASVSWEQKRAIVGRSPAHRPRSEANLGARYIDRTLVLIHR